MRRRCRAGITTRLGMSVESGSAATRSGASPALVDSVAVPAIEASEELVRGLEVAQHEGSGLQPAELSELARKIRDLAQGQVRELSHVLHAPQAPPSGRSSRATPVMVA